MVDNSGAPDPTSTDQIVTDTGGQAGADAGSGAPAAAAPAGSAPAPAPTGSGTLVGSDPADKAIAAPADWPADWREKIAAGDTKELARLQRLGSSPADVYKAYRALEAKLSSGQLKSAKPAEGATPEEVTAWRKENGIPDSADGYVPELGNGVVLGEADKPLLDGFKAAALNANMTPAQFNETLKWYYAEIDNFRAQQEATDSSYHAKAEDTLRKEWGNDYRPNINAINNITALAPEGVAERFLGGRTADGKKIGDDPGIIKWLAAIAKEFNPAAAYIPVGTAAPGKAIGDRIGEIEGMMRDRNSDYWRNDAIQAEYRDLIDARERYQGRGAA